MKIVYEESLLDEIRAAKYEGWRGGRRITKILVSKAELRVIRQEMRCTSCPAETEPMTVLGLPIEVVT